MKLKSFLLCSLSALFTTNAYASCGSAYCTLNTHWDAQGLWAEPGLRLDMRYEWINQNQLVGAADDAEDHREIKTLNQNLQTTLDYSFNETFGVSLSLPLVHRKHQHEHVDIDSGELETWNFTQLGDLKVLGRMKVSDNTNMNSGYGIQFGFKLPSGEDQITNSENELAERSLQPGTGTTEAIAGFYFYKSLPELKSRWFAQVLYAQALNEKDQFKNGKNFSLDLGYSYLVKPNINLMLQLNTLNKSKDTGANAEPENSGGTIISLSPGASFSISHSTNLYAFIHHRISSNLNGEQLSAKNSFVMGVSTKF